MDSPTSAHLRMIYLRNRTREIFVEGDATTVRTLLAVASLFWTIGLWWPLHTFDRPAFSWMAQVAGEKTWGFAMLLHFLGVMWRLYEVKPRIMWAFWINLYGVVLWSFMVGLITFSVGEFSPGSSLEFAVVIAAWVSLVKTGSNEGKGSP